MISKVRERFADDVDYFTDAELAYIVGYERIKDHEIEESETLWKIRAWAKYEDFLDAAELIFGEDEDCDFFTDEFYNQDVIVQMEQAKNMLINAGMPFWVTGDAEVWVRGEE